MYKGKIFGTIEYILKWSERMYKGILYNIYVYVFTVCYTLLRVVSISERVSSRA